MEFKMKTTAVGKTEEHKVTAEKVANQIWIHIHGKIIAVDAQVVRAGRAKKSAGEGSNLVKAPMPGKVTKILASPNSAVKKGQSLAMMEAMKMEYTLKAEIDGFVDTIDCVEGEQVALGKILIRLQKQEKS